MTMSNQQTQAPAEGDECSASGQSCNYGPHGPKGEAQCRYCGEAKPQPKHTAEPLPWLATRLWNARELWTCAADIEKMLSASSAAPSQPKGAAYQGPKRWTDEEIERGHVGIRWVNLEGVAGRPTTHDLREELARALLVDSRVCDCADCKASQSPAPVDGDLHTAAWLAIAMLERTAHATDADRLAAADALRAALATSAPAVAHEPTDIDEGWRKEVDDTDALLRYLGLDPEQCRTDGGWLNMPRIRSLMDEQEGAPLTDEQIDRAAQKLAALFDYPWEHMPEQGRRTMRENVVKVFEAALSQPPVQPMGGE